MIDLKARSNQYDEYVLVWNSQIKLFNTTQDSKFAYRVQDGDRFYFSVQSMLQALITENYKQVRSRTGKGFILVKRKDLVRVE